MSTATKQSHKTSTRNSAETTIATRLRENAEIVLAGYEILGEVEQRSGTLEWHEIEVSTSEAAILCAAGLFDSNKGVFAQTLGKCRAWRNMRAQLGSVGAIASARERAHATQVKLAAREGDLSTIDVERLGRLPLANQIAELQQQLLELESRAIGEAAEVRRLERDYEWLKTDCPEPLRRAVEALQAKAKQLDTNVASLREQLSDLIRRIARDNSEGFVGGSLDYHSANGTWFCYLERHCPAAIERSGGNRSVNRSRLGEHVIDLRDKIIPELQRALAELESKATDAWAEANAAIDGLMDPWIRTGEINIELLTTAVRD